MAKEMSGSGHDSPIHGRLPNNYGDPEAKPMNKMDTSKARETSKEFAAESPHPKAKQEEGRAGRQHLGGEMIGCKETHFNRERGRAAGNTGRKSY